MAITSVSVDSVLAGINDDVWVKAESDITGLTNFKYVFDVYDWNNNHLIRTKIFPDVNNGKGYFNIGPVIRNMLTFDWFSNIALDDFTAYQPSINGEIAVNGQVKVGEDYTVGISGITLLNQSTETYLQYNFISPLFKRRNFYYLENFNKFMTNRPGYGTWVNRKLDDNDIYDPLFIGYQSSENISYKTKFYNAAGALIANADGTIANTGANQMNQFNINPQALKTKDSLSFNIDDLEGGYYTVVFDDVNKFRVNVPCRKESPSMSLHFMNSLGLFDTAVFDCTNKLSMNTVRKSYSSKEMRFNDLPSYFNGFTYYENKVNYNQDIQWTYKLQMNFPTDDEWDWLAELIYSPQIYVYMNNYFHPVTIKTTNYEYYKQHYTKLKTFELEVELNQNRKGVLR